MNPMVFAEARPVAERLDSIIAHACTIEGWMSEAELRWLAEVATHVDSIAELGCWKGRSTYALAAACKGPVYAVDHWRGSQNELTSTHQEATQRDIIVDFRANLRELSNVRIVVSDIDQAAEFLPDVDMVFLDGSHDEHDVTSNIYPWMEKGWRIFAGHDFNWPGVRAAVRSAFGDRAVYLGAGSIWCVLADGVTPESAGFTVTV